MSKLTDYDREKLSYVEIMPGKKLSTGPQKTLTELISHALGKDHVWPSWEKLKKRTGLSLKTIKRHIKFFEDNGAIKVGEPEYLVDYGYSARMIYFLNHPALRALRCAKVTEEHYERSERESVSDLPEPSPANKGDLLAPGKMRVSGKACHQMAYEENARGKDTGNTAGSMAFAGGTGLLDPVHHQDYQAPSQDAGRAGDDQYGNQGNLPDHGPDLGSECGLFSTGDPGQWQGVCLPGDNSGVEDRNGNGHGHEREGYSKQPQGTGAERRDHDHHGKGQWQVGSSSQADSIQVPFSPSLRKSSGLFPFLSQDKNAHFIPAGQGGIEGQNAGILSPPLIVVKRTTKTSPPFPPSDSAKAEHFSQSVPQAADATEREDFSVNDQDNHPLWLQAREALNAPQYSPYYRPLLAQLTSRMTEQGLLLEWPNAAMTTAMQMNKSMMQDIENALHDLGISSFFFGVQKKSPEKEQQAMLQEECQRIAERERAAEAARLTAQAEAERLKNLSLKEQFSVLTQVYPRQSGQWLAWQAYKKMARDGELPAIHLLLRSINRQKTSTDWTRDNGRWIPGLSRWLHERRWLDLSYEQ